MNKYWYKYEHQRGRSIGCQPNGFIDYNDNAEEYGTVAYPFELTAQEMDNYDLGFLYSENICPVCKENELREKGGNALSRKDNETEICSDCGTREAMEEFQKFIGEES